MRVELGAVKLEQARPIAREGAALVLALWDAVGLVVRRLGELVGHLQEEQEGELLDIRHVGQAVVLEHARVGPDAGADLTRRG